MIFAIMLNIIFKNMMIKNNIKALLLAALGNFLEVYNYVLFAVMLPVISMLFFPSSSESLSIFFGFISFAISFLVAPLGSVFWGWIGDKYGRKVLLRYSMIIMSIPTMCIGLLPTFASIGFCAPVLLIVFRIFQGISASGGISGSKIFAMEHMGQSRYGIASGIITASGALGVLLAWCIGLYVVKNPEIENLWRVSFIFGGLLYFVGIVIRRYINEIENIQKDLQVNIESKINDIASILNNNRNSSLLVFMMGGMMGILSYTLHAFITPFMIGNGIEKHTAYLLSIAAIFITAISAVLAGLLLDYKKTKLISLMRKHIRSVIILSPIFWYSLMNGNLYQIIFAYIGLGYLLGVFAAISGVMMYSLFPPHVRCRGTMLNNSLGIALFGGLTPVIFDIISKYIMFGPALIISLYAMILLIVYKKLIATALH